MQVLERQRHDVVDAYEAPAVIDAGRADGDEDSRRALKLDAWCAKNNGRDLAVAEVPDRA